MSGRSFKWDHWGSVGAPRVQTPIVPGGHKYVTARKKTIQLSSLLWLLLDSARSVVQWGSVATRLWFDTPPYCCAQNWFKLEKMHPAGTSLGRERHLCVCAFAGPVCGKLDTSLKNVTLKSNEVTISFMSGLHRSGRGFLLSYATDQYPGRVSHTASACVAHIHRFAVKTSSSEGWMCACVQLCVCSG